MRFAAILLFSAAAFAQTKLSYFEGDVTVNGKTLTRNDGEAIGANTTLTTTTGRFEIYLAPDTYLRIGNNSTVRIVSAGAADLIAGSAVIDSIRANAGLEPLTLQVRDASVRISTPGEYEFRADPPQVKVYRGEASALLGGRTTTVRPSPAAYALGAVLQAGADADSLLDIWSTNRRIRLGSRLTGSSQPEQPLYGPNTDVTAGTSMSVGLIPLTGLPQLMYEPIRPYRPGSQFFGPSYSYWYPSYAYPAGIRPLGPQPYRPVSPGHIGGPHLPGPVIGH